VALREPEVPGFDGDALRVERLAEGLRVGDDLGRVGLIVRRRRSDRDDQRRQRVEVVVAGGTGEDTAVGRRPILLLMAGASRSYPALEKGRQLAGR
jgi:hypothetical protein